MTKTILIIFILILYVSCKTVETISQPTVIQIKLTAKIKPIYTIFLYAKTGKWIEIKPVHDIYTLPISAMSGGYSESLRIKHNVHDPNKYRIISIRRSGKEIKRLSINDIKQYPRDKRGYYILELEPKRL